MEKRAAFASALSAGYRVALSDRIAVNVEAVGMTHLYPGGRIAIGGMLAAQLRFYGWIASPRGKR